MSIIIYALCAVWAVGCLLGAAYLTKALHEESPVVGVIVGCCSIPFALVLGILPAGIYHDSQSPTVELHKANWTCTSSHDEAVTTYIKSGNVLMPMTTHHRECDAYERK
jgi:hypothetical protein